MRKVLLGVLENVSLGEEQLYVLSSHGLPR
jgi:hypothetical protein